MNTNRSHAGWFMIIPVGAILAFLGFGSPSSQSVAEQAKDRIVTMGEYSQINSGMSTSQVESIVGSSGVEEASSGDLDYHCEIISWQNTDGSNMIVTFENGFVSTKAQNGL